MDGDDRAQTRLRILVEADSLVSAFGHLFEGVHDKLIGLQVNFRGRSLWRRSSLAAPSGASQVDSTDPHRGGTSDDEATIEPDPN